MSEVRKIVAFDKRLAIHVLAWVAEYPIGAVREKYQPEKLERLAARMRGGAWRARPDHPDNAIRIRHRELFDDDHQETIKAVVVDGGKPVDLTLTGPASLLRKIINGNVLPGLQNAHPTPCRFTVHDGNHRLRAITQQREDRIIEVEVVAPQEFFDEVERQREQLARDAERTAANRERLREEMRRHDENMRAKALARGS